MNHVDWSAVRADDYKLPQGPEVPRLPELVAELMEMLRSPDPEVRDGFGYSIMANWVSRGYLPRDLQLSIGDQSAERFGDPDIQTRTFAPLILAVLADRGQVTDRWVTAFEQWYAAESDLRGHDPSLGWLHAVAHGADLLGEFGMTTTVSPTAMLELAARRMTEPTEFVWRDQEGDRLGCAIAQSLTRPELSAADATAWLDQVEALFKSPQEGPVPPRISNTLGTLRCLFVLMSTGVRVRGDDPAVQPAHAALIQQRLIEVLQLCTPGMS